jgi:hypothetical protein
VEAEKLTADKSGAEKLEAEQLKVEYQEAEQIDAPKLDLGDILESEDYYPSLSETLRNIDELQPRSSHPLLASDFAELQAKLEEGFTAPQLQQYILSFHVLPRPPKTDEPQPEEPPVFQTISPPWVVKKHPWVPMTSKGKKDTGDSSQWYIRQNMSPKEKLAVRIMRECWKLSSHKALETRGRLNVELADAEFSLLLRMSNLLALLLVRSIAFR